MIVLWGLMADEPLAAVWRALRRLGAEATFVDQRALPDYGFELSVAGGGISGTIYWPGGSLDVGTVGAVYVRPYDFTRTDVFASIDPASEVWRRSVRFEEAMLLWCELAPALVVNRPSSGGSNTSKPYQLELIRRCGFRVPETLITTDPDRVREFHRRHGRVIYKSLSDCRSVVSTLGEADLERLDAVQCCPTQFQRYVGGTDYRVHVLGGRTFVTRIESPGPDYRYGSGTRMSPADVPRQVARQCIAVTRQLGLKFSGIDLRLTPEGQWYCFEVNPSPGYTAFECGTDEISGALAGFLVRGL